jgi:hypothetical protein
MVMVDYDLTIRRAQDWNLLLEKVNVVVDPFIYRIGQIFLEGANTGSGTHEDSRWRAVANDVAGLAQFFDLIVLHDKLPAFNYVDTFGRDNHLNFNDRLGELVNQDDQVLYNVDVTVNGDRGKPRICSRP